MQVDKVVHAFEVTLGMCIAGRWDAVPCSPGSCAAVQLRAVLAERLVLQLSVNKQLPPPDIRTSRTALPQNRQVNALHVPSWPPTASQSDYKQ
jgi:hypothetical protein